MLDYIFGVSFKLFIVFSLWAETMGMVEWRVVDMNGWMDRWVGFVY